MGINWDPGQAPIVAWEQSPREAEALFVERMLNARHLHGEP